MELVAPSLPLLELSGRDQAGAGVGVTFMFGLPPCCIVLAHDLKDGAFLESQTRFLAWDGFVFVGVKVEECFHEHLDEQKQGRWRQINLRFG